MGYETDENVPGAPSDVDEPVEQEAINADDFVPDFDDEALHLAALGSPPRVGAHTFTIGKGTVRRTGEKSKNPGQPYYAIPVKSDDEPNTDSIFIRCSWPWTNPETGNVVDNWCGDGDALRLATGISWARKPAQEYFDEIEGLTVRGVVKHKNEDQGRYSKKNGQTYSASISKWL